MRKQSVSSGLFNANSSKIYRSLAIEFLCGHEIMRQRVDVFKIFAMKKNLGIAITAVALLLAGCVVSSVYPFYNQKDLIFDPSLLGKWDSTESTNEYIQFLESKDSNYLISMKMSADETNWIDGHLFQLKGQQFLDQQIIMTNACVGFGFVREHFICKIDNETNSLHVSWLSLDWLTDLLKKDNGAIRHIVVYDNSNDTKGRIAEVHS